jgi:hypothetical protein
VPCTSMVQASVSFIDPVFADITTIFEFLFIIHITHFPSGPRHQNNCPCCLDHQTVWITNVVSFDLKTMSHIMKHPLDSWMITT